MEIGSVQNEKFIERYSIPSSGKENLILVVDDDRELLATLLNSEGTLERISNLSVFASIIVVNRYPLDGPLIRDFVEYLYETLSNVEKIRFAYVVGVGSGCSVAQQLAINHTRFVRRLALFEPLSRAIEPSKLELVIDFLESRIPCGLPLRKGGTNFDSRSEIHRVHCPSLVCTNPESSSFLKNEADFLANRMPNAWRGEFNISEVFQSKGLLALFETLADFSSVPAKAPQKNLR